MICRRCNVDKDTAAFKPKRRVCRDCLRPEQRRRSEAWNERNRERVTPRLNAHRKMQNDASRKGAGNRYRPWTADELFMALDYQYSAQQVAAMLGRTHTGVDSVRTRSRTAPTHLMRAVVAKLTEFHGSDLS